MFLLLSWTAVYGQSTKEEVRDSLLRIAQLKSLKYPMKASANESAGTMLIQMQNKQGIIAVTTLYSSSEDFRLEASLVEGMNRLPNKALVPVNIVFVIPLYFNFNGPSYRQSYSALDKLGLQEGINHIQPKKHTTIMKPLTVEGYPAMR